jgi:RNA polymerase sigma-70 factor (ECF subfamily)
MGKLVRLLVGRGGNLEPAIRAFVEADYARLVAGLSLIGGSRAAAEDAVQEALARAWERMDRGERIESLTGWVTVVATNVARSSVRRRLAERRAHARLVREPDAGDMPVDSVDVARALARLPRRQREVVVLHYWMEMTLAETAGVLKVSEGTVKTAITRARRRLAGELGEPEGWGESVARPR